MVLRLLCPSLLLWSSAADAASLAAWDSDARKPTFETVLEARSFSYREVEGEPDPDLTAHVIYLTLIVAYAVVLTRTLPRSRAYAARAARAMSRTRAIIARKPLDRWADK